MRIKKARRIESSGEKRTAQIMGIIRFRSKFSIISIIVDSINADPLARITQKSCTIGARPDPGDTPPAKIANFPFPSQFMGHHERMVAGGDPSSRISIGRL